MDVLLLDLSSARIDGESLLPGFTNMIELLSYSHGNAPQIAGDESNAKRKTGRPDHQEFTMTKYRDRSSIQLIDFCNRAKVIPAAKIILGNNDGRRVTKIFVYELTNALVSSVSVGDSGDGRLVETVSFSCTEITWAYAAQDSGNPDPGNPSGTRKIATNSGT
jgi:type VI secretion system secreted protein Hcp